MPDRRKSVLKVIRLFPKNITKKTIVVLGAPRGGTSMLSGTLHELGVFMGENIGHQKEDPRFHSRTSIEEKRRAVAENNAVYDVWGWKLPNTIYYFDELREELINPVFLSIYRNPMEIAMSSAHRDSTELTDHLLRVPIDHYRKMHSMLAKHGDIPWAACSFDEVARNKARRPKIRLIRDLISLLDLKPTQDQIDAALKFIDYDKGYQS